MLTTPGKTAIENCTLEPYGLAWHLAFKLETLWDVYATIRRVVNEAVFCPLFLRFSFSQKSGSCDIERNKLTAVTRDHQKYETYERDIFVL